MESNESLLRETASPSNATATFDAESNENEPAVSVPVQKERRTNENGHDEPSPKRRRPNRRESVPKPKSNEPKENEEQQQQPTKKRGRPKLNKNVRTEHDSLMETEPQQPMIEQEKPKKQPKKGRQQNSIPAKTDEEKSGLDVAVAAAVASVDAIADRTISRVENMRKRNNCHEYLIRWTTGDNAEWIGRDIMIAKYAPHLIAFFERITQMTAKSSSITTKKQ